MMRKIIQVKTLSEYIVQDDVTTTVSLVVIDGGYCNDIMSFYQTGTNSYLSLSDSILMFGTSLHLPQHRGYQKSVFNFCIQFP